MVQVSPVVAPGFVALDPGFPYDVAVKAVVEQLVVTAVGVSIEKAQPAFEVLTFVPSDQVCVAANDSVGAPKAVE